MALGAIGFVGERLSEARAARGISAVDLADIVGVSAQTISKYENGHHDPRREVVFQLASKLQFPSEYFFRPVIDTDENPVFWRGRLSAPVNRQERAKVRLCWMKETVDYLGEFFDFPILNVPDLPVSDIHSVDDEYLELAAREVRSRWNIPDGPMPDVVEKLEANGILVSRIHVNADKLDAFSQWSEKHAIPFVVLGRDKASAVRQRFDALHELAHIVIHRNLKQRQLNNRVTYKAVEAQADRLASFLLLPEQDFFKELYAPSLDAFLSIKERWGASIGSMIMRCQYLGIVTDAEARRMWINLGRRGWRKSEPLDNKIRKEEPHLLRRSFELLIENKIQSVSDIRKALPFPVSDLEEIADLPSGTLLEASDGRVEPTLKKKTESNVVDFRKN